MKRNKALTAGNNVLAWSDQHTCMRFYELQTLFTMCGECGHRWHR